MNRFKLAVAGLMAAGAALVAAPEPAKAQFSISFGVGSPYYGGWGHPGYGYYHRPYYRRVAYGYPYGYYRRPIRRVYYPAYYQRPYYRRAYYPAYSYRPYRPAYYGRAYYPGRVHYRRARYW
jgi:hypothetical protein